MLQPGIEYFAAPSDVDAITFAEGRAAAEVPLVRSDGLRPDDILPVFGALLTGRRIADLATEPELHELWVDDRGAMRVRLLRLPVDVSAALVAADDTRLSAIAARVLVYPEFAGVPIELVTQILTDLANCARAGGDLYARVIEPTAPIIARQSHVAALMRWLPWVGVVTAVGLGAVAWFVVTRDVPAVYYPLLIGSAALASYSVQLLIARRRLRTITQVASRAMGSVVVPIDAGSEFMEHLRSVVAEVHGTDLDAPSTPSSPVYLIADPSGFDVLFADERTIHFPAGAIRGLTTSEEPVAARAAGGARVRTLLDVCCASPTRSRLCGAFRCSTRSVGRLSRHLPSSRPSSRPSWAHACRRHPRRD